MSFLKSISQFFGLDREPAKGTWPRKVELHELPPQRIPILPPHLRPPLPPCLREVTGPEHLGWPEWKPRKPQAPHNPFRDEQMDNFLRDGAVEPKGRED